MRGITLIALVISIVVMLIMIGVILSATINDGGIFKRAKEAIDITEEKIEYEQEELPKGMKDYVQEVTDKLR